MKYELGNYVQMNYEPRIISMTFSKLEGSDFLIKNINFRKTDT